ncbi:MAG: hypothetical protein M3O36_04250 [Myxococcota bacterium]|nr:hypothetical protein [Myxococcota bacterium]
MTRRIVDAAVLLVVGSHALHLAIALARYMSVWQGRFNDPLADIDGLPF